MSGPFISLTLPGVRGLGPQPILVGVHAIRTVNPNWQRKPDHTGTLTAESYDLVGSWICVGDGEDGTFPVTETFHDVANAIRDAVA